MSYLDNTRILLDSTTGKASLKYFGVTGLGLYCRLNNVVVFTSLITWSNVYIILPCEVLMYTFS